MGVELRTIDECVKLSKEDVTIRTSILDKRFLFGDRSVFDKLNERFHEDVIAGRGAEFVAAKLQERSDRHAREGDSRYRVEPNVKDGKGGLRDGSLKAFGELGGAYLAIVGGAATSRFLALRIFARPLRSPLISASTSAPMGRMGPWAE